MQKKLGCRDRMVVEFIIPVQSVPITTNVVSSNLFNATFNNIPVISLWSVLLMEETGVPGENH
jgi:hypothetical protein